MRHEDIIIVGSGPYGIGLAVELKKLGKNPLVLERGDKPASAWRNRHPQLRLNTHRWNSGFAHHPLPRSVGRWPSRDDYVAYLDGIASVNRCRIETGQNVRRIDQAGNGWSVETNTQSFTAGQVVIATGFDQQPEMPEWPGMAKFPGEIIHARDFGSVEQYHGKSVLVVGAGNSGTDVLNCLAGQPLKDLAVSVRNGPVVVPAELLGFPLQLTAPMLERLPRRLADLALAATERTAFGDLARFGLRNRRSITSAASRLASEHVAPAVDRGFIRAVRQGKVAVYPQIERFDGRGIEFTSGAFSTADVVICATGYSCGLDRMVGHLGVLDADGRPVRTGGPVPEGLWFALVPPPLGGSLRAIARAVVPMARAILKEQSIERAIGESGHLPRPVGFMQQPVKEGH